MKTPPRYTYYYQFAGYDFPVSDDKGKVDFATFVRAFTEFPWAEQMRQRETMDSGCSATISVVDHEEDAALWVSVTGYDKRPTFLLGLVFGVEQWLLNQSAEPEMRLSNHIFIAPSRRSVLSMFRLFFAGNSLDVYDGLRNYRSYSQPEATWYFWKWAANGLEGQPSEISAAIANEKIDRAMMPFDAAPLIERLKLAKTTIGIDGSKWRWNVINEHGTRLARHVALVLPFQEWHYPVFQSWVDLFLPLDLFGWAPNLGESFPGTLPKHFVWELQNSDNERSIYDVKPEDVSRLLKEVQHSGTVLLMNHQNDYVNVAKAYGRFTVEWRHYPDIRNDKNRFSHWKAGYAGDPAKSATGKNIIRKFIPEFMDDIRQGGDGYDVARITRDQEYELITPGDTAFILRAFLRAENRPPNFRWTSMARELRKSH